jgi:hypothetical protein
MAREVAEHYRPRFDAFTDSGTNFYLLGEQFLFELEDTDLLIDDLRVMEEAPLPHPSFLWLLPRGYLAAKHRVGRFPIRNCLHTR